MRIIKKLDDLSERADNYLENNQWLLPFIAGPFVALSWLVLFLIAWL